ncbi:MULTISPECIES: carbonic anhydrase [Roseiflexus]|jgi:carbonic anhydrase|uniref:carbonic anhydrase n=1 Tax=Roseiflexus castenholzii (strain DSM 13941 / HLO8) TaxID=383372 RepID=A7NIX1_ROSCS|nr:MULTISPECIES: carbonic anhydrase [Roseiflexus]ABU57429.1 carbonic anhydrase [Roseiflexus castenholzii DSM 13941]GIW00298.1 MAG: carbonic anhydrase [Roseiflexus sp.]
MTRFDEFLKANEAFAANFTHGDLAMPPARRVAVVACMDARLHPEKVLGIDIGDAHVIRNAGGRAHDAIRSLVISQQLLGTREIVVLHHTDCGMLTFTNEQLAAKIAADLNVHVEGQDFLPFADLEQSVRDDVALLRNSPLIPKDIPISGAIYDVRTGRVHEVVRA